MAGESLIGNLAVLLTMETAAFEKGTSHASKLLRKTQRQFEDVAGKLAGIGTKMSLAITAPLAGLAAKGIQEAQETAQAMGQVNAALTSMGPVAGRTADQLKSAADALEMKSLFEGDEILRKVTANLLTFGNISGKAFDQAQQAAVNLSARLGTDLQSSAILVGKALNDPIKGMTAMGRAGIQFSEGQKATIKSLVATGQTAQAQTIILGELERQFGGAAAAAANADPFHKSTVAFKQMAETIGTALLPIIPVFTDAVVSVANAFAGLSPGMQKTVIIAGGLAAAIGPVMVGLGGLISVTGSLLPVLIKLGPVLAVVRTAMLALMANPYVLGGAAVITGIYLAWKNWDKITAFVGRMVTGVIGWLKKLSAPFDWVRNKAREVGDAFAKLYDRVVGHSYIPDMVDQIGEHMRRLDKELAQPVAAATSKAAESFRQLQTDASALLSQLFPEQASANEFNAQLDLLRQYADKGRLSVDQLAAAIGRLEDRQATAKFGPQGPVTDFSEQPAMPDGAALESAVNSWAEKLPDIIGKTQEWGQALRGVAENGIRSLADGLTGVIMGTAKLGDVFKSVIAQMISDLIRLQIQQMMMKMFATAAGAPPGSFPGLATGGTAIGGRPYLVGERGPELFMPGRTGQVISNDNLRGMGGVTVNAPITIQGNASRETINQMGVKLRTTISGATNRGF